jgi:hypothetical protein
VNRKIPEDAFARYVGMGVDRSYSAIAKEYAVTKRAVVKHARKERWAERLAEIEKLARETANAKLANDLADMQVRHGKLIKAMAARAAQALQQHPLTSGMDAIRAAEIAIKLERVIAGEPAERSELTVAETTKREIERFLAPAEPELDEEGDEDADDIW